MTHYPDCAAPLLLLVATEGGAEGSSGGVPSNLFRAPRTRRTLGPCPTCSMGWTGRGLDHHHRAVVHRSSSPARLRDLRRRTDVVSRRSTHLGGILSGSFRATHTDGRPRTGPDLASRAPRSVNPRDREGAPARKSVVAAADHLDLDVVQSSVATHVQVHRVTDREELRPSAVSWDLPAVVGRASPDHLRTGSTGSTRESVLMLANDDPPVADEDSTRSPASMNGYSSARTAVR